jgi:hypothetical protein
MMLLRNVGELERNLQQAGIDPMFYSIGEFKDDCACIVQADDGMWETFAGNEEKNTISGGGTTKATPVCS